MSESCREALLGRILPEGVVHSEQQGELHGVLLPDEAALLGAISSVSRQRHFAAGRTCAREALARLGPMQGPILRGEAREPLWPPGFCGSITHCEDYCAAAVASRDDWSAIGIDAERHGSLPAGVLDLIATDRERRWLHEQPAPEGVHLDCLLFCVKESLYKAWYPLVHRRLDFQQAVIELELDGGTFKAWIEDPSFEQFARRNPIPGRFLLTAALVLSAVCLPRHQAAETLGHGSTRVRENPREYL